MIDASSAAAESTATEAMQSAWRQYNDIYTAFDIWDLVLWPAGPKIVDVTTTCR